MFLNDITAPQNVIGAKQGLRGEACTAISIIVCALVVDVPSGTCVQFVIYQ